jgi:asparagine synthase (glutamine-hydrolysing)
MAAQFGIWNFNGMPPGRSQLARAGQLLARYGPDADATYASGGLSILHRGFHTTAEARGEQQPYVSKSGFVLTWDGRLDNRAELIGALGGALTKDAVDVSIVALAYERWKTDCLRKFIGDWALSIWEPKERTVTLAKDPIGTRPMYYTYDRDRLMWSTVLDPLVPFGEKSLEPEMEYIAGWLSFYPATHLTPYRGVHAVPPSSFVLLSPQGQTVRKFWDFDALETIRYQSDGEYEEHFLTLFARAVRRRLRSDTPVLAELSGGMDSSSIVCVADREIARGEAGTPRLDTVSCYDDSEPNWNERPFFEKVEQKRGRTGCHIDVGSRGLRSVNSQTSGFVVTPGADSGSFPVDQLAACVESQGNRVLLSGIGGDEVTGGVPTPTPELADLLARARFRTLARQLKVWALNKRVPWFHLLLETARPFLAVDLLAPAIHKRPAPWLRRDFVRSQRAALSGYEDRLTLVGSLPSFQMNLATLETLRRQFACSTDQTYPLLERRYPFLDRELLQFLYAVPRGQLVRPGQRRSLMRRSLTGLVPDEILNRRRKAFVARGPRQAISSAWPALVELYQNMISASFGIVDPNKLFEALNKARTGEDVALVPLMRTIAVERWLRGLYLTKSVDFSATAAADSISCNALPGRSETLKSSAS